MPELIAPVPDSQPAPRPAVLRGAAIASVAAAVPETAVGNAPIAARLGVSEKWILERTGIRERRIASPGETVADYATEASVRALEEAGVAPEAIDLVLVATMSNDRPIPNAAPQVAERIGAFGAGAIDLGAACAGFVSGLALAASQVESGRAEAVLVAGADLLSPLTNVYDKRTAALFGDGAGAAVVTAAPAPGLIGPVVLGSDGARAELISAEGSSPVIRMNGHDTFRHAVDRLCEASIAACEQAGVALGEVEVFAYHQANGRILAAVADRLGLVADRVVNCIDRYGNTSAATIPLALVEARERGMLGDGDRALLAGFGSGLTWAATVIEWGGGER